MSQQQRQQQQQKQQQPSTLGLVSLFFLSKNINFLGTKMI